MAPNPGQNKAAAAPESKKRKNAPGPSSSSQRGPDNKRVKRDKTQAARKMATQHADSALKNGELDLQSFLKSRQFEIKALEDTMRNAKLALSSRAFQQVPRDMRRRTASHNVKRVPKRLQRRAKREMVDDNTPTVNARTRKPRTSRGRLRAETAKRLGILAGKKRARKATGLDGEGAGIDTRAARPKIRRNKLNDPPRPKAKFRKRQVHKTWLPTHLWHAKRAKMTEPKNPLWRFAIPITSTEKSYRPTHRAGGVRGAVAWDMSYMSTIGLHGPVEGLHEVLSKLGVEDGIWQARGEKWRAGKRSWSGWLSRDSKGQRVQIGPSTIVWCASEPDAAEPEGVEKQKRKPTRRLFIRIHPSAFLELWTEVLRLATLQRPAVHAEDLRFEIGSIDITGPGSTEALLGILHPYQKSDGDEVEAHGRTFTSLAGVTHPGSLPQNSLLAFSITDPRLHYPPRPVSLPPATDEDANFALLQTLSAWPADSHSPSSALFDRDARFKGTRLPSQKALNRRKALAPPGSYPPVTATDPLIPIMLLASRSKAGSSSSQGTWTLLAPWKCILPIWYGLVHYPLSSGGNPRFGGLDELRQIHFEHGVPWFPADYPGTEAGFAWEVDEREKKLAEWNRRPKGKRVEWTSLDLGSGRKGEIGRGWGCDFEKIIESLPELGGNETATTSEGVQQTQTKEARTTPPPMRHLPSKDFVSLLSRAGADLPPPSTVATIQLTLVSRGVASPCARIYRLPTPDPSQDSPPSGTPLPSDLRQQWLSLLPPPASSKAPPNPKSKDLRGITRIPLDVALPQRVRLLARSLLQTPPRPYPAPKDRDDGHLLVPDERDLVGFVTTGEFSLAEGKGVAVGTVVVARLVEGVRAAAEMGDRGRRLCIVRNAGESIGRLARWEAV